MGEGVEICMGSALPLPLTSDGPASAVGVQFCQLPPPPVAEASACRRAGTGMASVGGAAVRGWAILRGSAAAAGGGGGARLGAAARCDAGGLQYWSKRSGFAMPKRFSWCSGSDIRQKHDGSASSSAFGAFLGSGLPFERRAGKRIGR